MRSRPADQPALLIGIQRAPPATPPTSLTDWHSPCFLIRVCLANPAGEQPLVQIHLVHFYCPTSLLCLTPRLEPLGLASREVCGCLRVERANSALLDSLTLGVWGISQMSVEQTILLPRMFTSLSLCWTICSTMVLRVLVWATLISLEMHRGSALFPEEVLQSTWVLSGPRVSCQHRGPGHAPPPTAISHLLQRR